MCTFTNTEMGVENSCSFVFVYREEEAQMRARARWKLRRTGKAKARGGKKLISERGKERA